MIPIRHFAIALLVGVLAAPAAVAQTTFTVTLATKTSNHPYFGMGHPDGYVIDGVEANELTLTRGETYVFQMSNIASFHPFYLSTSDAGGGVDPWDDGVTNNMASGNETLTFTVPATAPDELWYQCINHQFMGWRLNIVNPVGTEEQAPAADFTITVTTENPSRTATTFELTLPEARSVLVEAFDAAGRRVAVLHDGTLARGAHRLVFEDADLPAGVYLIRATTEGLTAERRITLIR